MSTSHSHPCRSTGCSKSFANAISRGLYEKHCQHRVSGIRKRQAELEAVYAARKRARLETKALGDEGEWEDIEGPVVENDAAVEPPAMELPVPPPAPSSVDTMSTRGRRHIRLPKRFDDMVPSSRNALPSQYASVIPPPAPSPEPPSPTSPSSSSSSEEEEEFESTPNAFGVFYRFFRKPQEHPEDDGALEEVCDAPGLEGSNATSTVGYQSIMWLSRNVAIGVDDSQPPEYGPFANASQFRLFDYFYDRSEVRSHDAFDDLLHILRAEDFHVEDLNGFSARKGDRALEEWVAPSGSVFSKEDGWQESSVCIPLPPPKVDPTASEASAQTFEVTGIIHRSLSGLVKAVVQDTAS